MLSTSNKTKFQYQYLLIAVVLLAMVSVIALYQTGVLPTIPAGQSATQNLTTLSAADVSAYRWDAIAKFYESQRLPTGDLTLLSAADASAYRWDAVARFYAGQAAAVNLSWPARPDFSHLSQQAIIPITGSVTGLAIYHQSEWAAPVAVHNSLAQYYLSERGTFATAQNGMSIYHQSERNPVRVQGMSFHYTSPGR